MQGNKLYLEDIWNEILVAVKRNRPMVARTHIWATEIGKNYFDRYHKMIGTPPTRVIEERILRKFAAGDIFEELVGDYLAKIGLIESSQEHIIIPESETMLKVSGKIDYIASMPDWNKAREAVKQNNEEEADITNEILNKLIDKLSAEFPDGLPPTIFEIKTINSMVFWAKKDYLQEAYPFHIMQLYTYLKAKNLPEGRIVYLSKDDLTIKEMTVFHPVVDLSAKWNKDVAEMTKYIRDGVEPPKPEQIVFEPHGCIRFQKDKVKYKTDGVWKENWEVKFSSYFEMITGHTSEEEWLVSLKPEMKKRNDEFKAEYIKKNNL